MEKYLYGAAVQGIQQFIFQTNELKHIVGASELVAQICTTAFDEFGKNGESIVRAAGNIKYIFDNETDCIKAVREFPKKVMNMAPGITISQAVVPLSSNFDKDIDSIEAKLKTQRNKPSRSVTTGLIGIKRANNSGLPIVDLKIDSYADKKRKVIYLDESTLKKERKQRLIELCKKSFGFPDIDPDSLAYDISDITDKNDWIAIIHADGNGLGKVLQAVGKKKDVLKEFSQKLDIATKEAANFAYKEIEDKFHNKFVIPIRPVVLSGDDMTVIIRGDLALDYAKLFIDAFKTKTKQYLSHILRENNVFAGGADYLTACAGIAFIKSSYPFYYGYQLAEELCGHAKKDTKAIHGADSNHLPPSCLLFHKVQDSFIYDYKEIIKRELTAVDGLSFMAGPYYNEPQAGKFTVDQLQDFAKLLFSDEGDGIKSGVRNWISLRIKSKSIADQRKGRMLQVFTKTKDVEDLTREDNNRCIAYDVLSYDTIMNQQTNETTEV